MSDLLTSKQIEADVELRRHTVTIHQEITGRRRILLDTARILRE